jgi:hypothetical protein
MSVTMNDAFIVFIATGRVGGVAGNAPIIFFLNFHRAIHTPVLTVGFDCSRRRQGKGEHHQAEDDRWREKSESSLHGGLLLVERSRGTRLGWNVPRAYPTKSQ